jgi:hypothetical protein
MGLQLQQFLGTAVWQCSAENGGDHMSYTAQVVKVMIASPSDVADERQLVRDVIQEWNTIHSENCKLVLMPVGWETHSVPEMGNRPQAIINKQLLETCDLLVAVFWMRLGTPTGVADSGTVEEINKHLASAKPAMIYFSAVPGNPDRVDREQYEKLRAFKDDLRSRGLFDEYENVITFRTKFARHLAQRVIASFLGGEYAGELDRSLPAERPLDLTEAACDLLAEAVQDRDGIIIQMHTMDGFDVRTNDRSFVELGSGRSAARWRAAVDELHNLRLVEDRGGDGEFFFVTNAGYEIGDLLKAM